MLGSESDSAGKRAHWRPSTAGIVSGWNSVLYAPLQGKIAFVVNDRADNPIAKPTAKSAGNYLSLDIGGGRYVLMAHLKKGSVRVKVGDSVSAGQEIAAVAIRAIPANRISIFRFKSRKVLRLRDGNVSDTFSRRRVPSLQPSTDRLTI
jgi:hypothetical protein